jgi:hypothetical protein
LRSATTARIASALRVKSDDVGSIVERSGMFFRVYCAPQSGIKAVMVALRHLLRQPRTFGGSGMFRRFGVFRPMG